MRPDLAATVSTDRPTRVIAQLSLVAYRIQDRTERWWRWTVWLALWITARRVVEGR